MVTVTSAGKRNVLTSGMKGVVEFDIIPILVNSLILTIGKGGKQMAYLILFMVRKTQTANNLIPIFDNYEWWIDLAKNALEYADEFEMRLWEDDAEAIKSGQKFGRRVPNNQTKEIVYQGSITPEFKQEVLTNYLTPEGYIKWFSLILKRENESIFFSEHYGNETHILVNTKEEVQAIQYWAKNYPIIWRVDVYEYKGASE